MNTDTRIREIDVIIPTLNRPEQLRATLDALTRQSYRDFGVVVVDDGSRHSAEALTAPVLRDALEISFVRNDRSLGAGPARNRGVAQSQARYVVFIDDDCIAGPDLVLRHHEALSSADGPAVSLGPILSVPGLRLPVWSHWDAYQFEREYTKIANGHVEPGWGHVFTGNVGLRRADFLAVGGFDERFHRGEDTDLGYRLARYGCRFEFDPAALVRHDSQRSLSSWIRIAAAAALSDIDMHRNDPESNRLAMVTEQLGSRHWALRLTRRLIGGPIAGRCAIVGALGLALLLHAVRADRVALWAMSIVRDLTYWRTLKEALPGPESWRPSRLTATEVA